jgi:hypothetical protein
MKKRITRIILVLSFIAGMLYSTESFYQFFRFRAVSFDSLALVSDVFFWKRIDPLSHRVWPILMLRSGRIKKSIMSVAPVSVKIEMTAPGFFEVDYLPLEPWFLVFWSGGEWFLSREGRMWSVHHSLNNIIIGQLAREGPVLVWGEDLPDPLPAGMDIENSVVDSSLPIEEVVSWRNALAEAGFYSRISSVTIRKREGRRIIELLERTEAGSVRILLADTTENWKTLFEAVDEILSQSGIRGKNLVLDTTYTGRILVRVIS